MNEATKLSPKGSDWTRLLTDPDLVSHLGKLLQTYREVPPEQREAALLGQCGRSKTPPSKPARHRAKGQKNVSPLPPRRRHRRALPIPNRWIKHPRSNRICSRRNWIGSPPLSPDQVLCGGGNSHRGRGRAGLGQSGECGPRRLPGQTASAVPPGKALEIGLWVASGKIWVKGVIISGVATHSAASFGVRVKFSEAELSEKEHLREFLEIRRDHHPQVAKRKSLRGAVKGLSRSPFNLTLPATFPAVRVHC